jgi:hypothetical protein
VGFIVTNRSLPSRAVVRFENKRGMAEQGIKEGKQATQWSRLSGPRFRAKAARFPLSLRAYNLDNRWRRRVLLKRIDAWSLTSLPQRLVKTGGRRLFGAMRGRIAARSSPAGEASRPPDQLSATPEAGEGKVSEAAGERAAVSGLGILSRGKTGPFPGRGRPRTLNTRRAIALRSG